MNKYVIAAMATLFGTAAAFAQEITDIETLEAKVEQACPQRWEAIAAQIEFVGTVDPWQGDESDRQAFNDYLADIVTETQTNADLPAMEKEVVTVITECAAAKTAYYSALRTTTTNHVGGFTIGNPPEGEEDDPVPNGTAAELAADSCREILFGHPDSVSGVYWIQSITADTPVPFEVYCDMESEGGGWTLIAAQYETDPVTDWDEGFQPDYDPGPGSGASFALQRYDIPPHVETAFGKDTEATYVDYARFVYDTNDIPVVELMGKKSGELFHLHRDVSAYHADYDPESTESTDPEWSNALTFDQTAGSHHSWAFAPNHSQTNQRGYSLTGDVSGTAESHAWTVWVR